MIRFDRVSKVFHTKIGRRAVLDDESFVIRRGTSIGIVGINGAGKSTLTRLMAGIEYPTSGVIRREMSVSWPLGFSGAFQGSLTGADNARFIARIYGQSIPRILGFVNEFAELGDYMKLPMKTYSSGMRARLAFAVSLAVDFDCYIVDEVIAVGDQRFRDRCRDALAKRRQSGALIMVSHDPHTLREHCEQGGILHNGKLTFYPSIDDMSVDYERLMTRAA